MTLTTICLVIELNDTIFYSNQEAMIREMREETGIVCKPDTLICVDTQETSWYRMAYAVEITGGTIKTKPDKE
jgi:8-oxo-dGTP pyrophosphatase MutT (NUDIX family)